MTSTRVCKMMNQVYDKLKTLDVEQLIEAKRLSWHEMPQEEAALFIHQCNYTLMKKYKKKW